MATCWAIESMINHIFYGDPAWEPCFTYGRLEAVPKFRGSEGAVPAQVRMSQA